MHVDTLKSLKKMVLVLHVPFRLLQTKRKEHVYQKKLIVQMTERFIHKIEHIVFHVSLIPELKIKTQCANQMHAEVMKLSRRMEHALPVHFLKYQIF